MYAGLAPYSWNTGVRRGSIARSTACGSRPKVCTAVTRATLETNGRAHGGFESRPGRQATTRHHFDAMEDYLESSCFKLNYREPSLETRLADQVSQHVRTAHLDDQSSLSVLT